MPHFDDSKWVFRYFLRKDTSQKLFFSFLFRIFAASIIYFNDIIHEL